jgi:hypothetical protein
VLRGVKRCLLAIVVTYLGLAPGEVRLVAAPVPAAIGPMAVAAVGDGHWAVLGGLNNQVLILDAARTAVELHVCSQ